MIDLSRVLPFWASLSRPRQEVLAEIAAEHGVWVLLGMTRLLAAAGRGNVESVCAEIGDDALEEKYRRG